MIGPRRDLFISIEKTIDARSCSDDAHRRVQMTLFEDTIVVLLLLFVCSHSYANIAEQSRVSESESADDQCNR